MAANSEVPHSAIGNGVGRIGSFGPVMERYSTSSSKEIGKSKNEEDFSLFLSKDDELYNKVNNEINNSRASS